MTRTELEQVIDYLYLSGAETRAPLAAAIIEAFGALTADRDDLRTKLAEAERNIVLVQDAASLNQSLAVSNSHKELAEASTQLQLMSTKLAKVTAERDMALRSGEALAKNCETERGHVAELRRQRKLLVGAMQEVTNGRWCGNCVVVTKMADALAQLTNSTPEELRTEGRQEPIKSSDAAQSVATDRPSVHQPGVCLGDLITEPTQPEYATTEQLAELADIVRGACMQGRFFHEATRARELADRLRGGK